MLMQRKKSYEWTPPDPHEAVLLLWIVFSPIFLSGCWAFLSVNSSNLHQQQALWDAWLVPEGVLDLCLLTDNSWPCLMCICAFSPYHLTMETGRLSELLCFLSKYEIMDTGQKLCNPNHCNILYPMKFIKFHLDWPPLPLTPKKEKTLQIYLCCFVMEPHF
jgi:hypothetical protein